MTSAQSGVSATLVMIALFCIPPILSFRACRQRAAYLRQREASTALAVAGSVFSALTLFFNVGVIAISMWAAADDGIDLGNGHGVAAVLTWLCLWIWIILTLFLRSRRRRRVY